MGSPYSTWTYSGLSRPVNPNWRHKDSHCAATRFDQVESPTDFMSEFLFRADTATIMQTTSLSRTNFLSSPCLYYYVYVKCPPCTQGGGWSCDQQNRKKNNLTCHLDRPSSDHLTGIDFCSAIRVRTLFKACRVKCQQKKTVAHTEATTLQRQTPGGGLYKSTYTDKISPRKVAGVVLPKRKKGKSYNLENSLNN